MSAVNEATLALRFDAPMQSWGVRSRFIQRDTETEPTKSGVVGLLACALAVPREDDDTVRELAALRMGVRVDREGLLEHDYQVTENVPNTEGKNHRTVVSERYYLAGALFLVAVEGPADRIGQLEAAVRRPHWPLFFGRKAFVPATPLIETTPEGRRQHGTGIHEAHLWNVLQEHPWLEHHPDQRKTVASVPEQERPQLRTVVDVPPTDEAAERRHDRPVSFAEGARRYGSRAVKTGHVPLTDAMIDPPVPNASESDLPCS